ncbi:electron transport complex subunit RsxG [Salinivibrio sp. ES.052]|uniref:electron transport complex subunit RsxG n=1 Tax=Salinivibrio sp. ES.052 TaxID=1882823 RepID=UPI0009287AF2|nr:electron transport complex subunit RsxG [Salinivibrio sp. ES.052]SIN77845.1 electron transport complex protein RnfG [Salinivibrio sp. ES.052]
MIETIRKHGGILAVAALLSTALVAVTNALTEDTIKEQQQIQLSKALNQVIPEDRHDNPLHQNCRLIQHSEALGTDEAQPFYVATLNDDVTAVAIQAIAPNGYNGAIKVLIGMDATSHQVLGVRVLEHNETPGLGDKVSLRVSNWIRSFSGKTVTSEEDKRWAVKKDGGQFDQFTGATITPRAVVTAVKKAAWFVSQQQAALINQPVNCGGAS